MAQQYSQERQQEEQRRLGDHTIPPLSNDSPLQHNAYSMDQPFPSIRSNPIAIVRNDQAARHADTSDDDVDDDDDDSVIDVEMDARNIASRNAARSLPSRLLRAPMLGSVPANDDYISYHNMLPPPMNLAEQHASSTTTPAARSVSHISYGSLRESNLQKRFLDGPSSYRDKRTGAIQRMNPQVRFQEPVSSTPSSLSIGERILQSRKKKGTSKTAEESSKLTSSLAAMLKDSDATDEPDPSPAQPVFANSAFYDDSEEANNNAMYQLSTSLTGLEVLQSCFRSGTSRAASAARMESRSLKEELHSKAKGDTLLEELDELPRDSMGNNALLSRSYSDPTPHLQHNRHRVQMLSTRSPMLNSQGHLLPPMNERAAADQTLRLPGQLMASNPTTFGTNAYQATFATPQPEPMETLPANENDGPNPDTEAAFDMDLE